MSRHSKSSKSLKNLNSLRKKQLTQQLSHKIRKKRKKKSLHQKKEMIGPWEPKYKNYLMISPKSHKRQKGSLNPTKKEFNNLLPRLRNSRKVLTLKSIKLNKKKIQKMKNQSTTKQTFSIV